MSNRKFALCPLVLALSLVLISNPTLAKDNSRGGFFIGFGVGGGAATPDTDIDYEGGATANLRGGWALKDDLTLGLESSLWWKEEGGVTVTFSATTAGVTYYPGNVGFFVKAGAGLGSIELSASSGGTTVTATETGFALLTGVGYEHRMTTKFALGVEGNYSYLNVVDELSGTNFLGAALIFNWYWQRS